MDYSKYGDKVDRRTFSTIPPTEEEWIKFGMEYAMARYSSKFPLDIQKLEDKAQDCYDYWLERGFKRKKAPLVSFKRTMETWMRKDHYHTLADKKKIWEQNAPIRDY